MTSAGRFPRRTLFAALAAPLALSACGALRRSDGPGIYEIGVGDGRLRRLSDDPARPVPSPDGSRIAWSSERGVFALTPATGSMAEFSGSERAAVPAWSPDAATLAWIDWGTREIRFAASDGGGARSYPLVAPGLDRGLVAAAMRNQPSWAPDGSAIAYVAWDGNGDEVYRIAPDGTDRRRLSNIRMSGERVNGELSTWQMKATADAVRPDWSPSGRRIAFGQAPETGGAPGGIYAVDALGGRQRRLSSRTPGFGPLWSPDGSAILFVQRADPDANLYVLDLRDRLLRPITFGSRLTVLDAAWAPDSRRVAFSADGAIHVHDLPTRATTLVADTPLDDRAPAWTPDGRSILFMAAEDLFEQPSLPDIP